MATMPGNRKLLGAGTGSGVPVGGGEVAAGVVAAGVVAAGVVADATAKPAPVTVTVVPVCPLEGDNVITGLPTVSSTVIAGS
jgi:hypothetical protein